MRLSPREVDKLALAQAAHLAQELTSGSSQSPRGDGVAREQILELIREGPENGSEQSVAQIGEGENDFGDATSLTRRCDVMRGSPS